MFIDKFEDDVNFLECSVEKVVDLDFCLLVENDKFDINNIVMKG